MDNKLIRMTSSAHLPYNKPIMFWLRRKLRYWFKPIIIIFILYLIYATWDKQVGYETIHFKIYLSNR